MIIVINIAGIKKRYRAWKFTICTYFCHKDENILSLFWKLDFLQKFFIFLCYFLLKIDFLI